MYELWEMNSRNLAGTYPTEATALAIVRAAIAQHGREAVESYALLYENSRGRSKLIAEGKVLIERALAAAPARAASA